MTIILMIHFIYREIFRVKGALHGQIKIKIILDCFRPLKIVN